MGITQGEITEDGITVEEVSINCSLIHCFFQLLKCTKYTSHTYRRIHGVN